MRTAARNLPLAWPRPQRPLRHLLIVAGARGAGKSTFIEAARSGALDARILACLPRNIDQWQVVEAQHHPSWMAQVRMTGRSRIQHLVLHCDIVTMQDPHMRPALNVLALSRAITAVSVKPSVERLAAQFGMRNSAYVSKVLAGEMVVTRAGGSRLEQARFVEEARQLLLRLYSNPDWVERLYSDWDATIRRLAIGATLRCIEVAPTGENDSGAPGWRLNYDSGAADRH